MLGEGKNMWGICFDISLCEGTLFQHIIEYRMIDQSSAIIIQPVSDVGIDIQMIRPIDTPPMYQYGDSVSPVNHTDMKAKIRAIVWHFKNNAFNYYIKTENRKISRRYYEEDLIKID